MAFLSPKPEDTCILLKLFLHPLKKYYKLGKILYLGKVRAQSMLATIIYHSLETKPENQVIHVGNHAINDWNQAIHIRNQEIHVRNQAKIKQSMLEIKQSMLEIKQFMLIIKQSMLESSNPC